MQRNYLEKRKKVFDFIRSHVKTTHSIGLHEYYWLEAMDVHHRDARYLNAKRDEWKKLSDEKQNFFDWLDNAPHNNNHVIYLNDEERKSHELKFVDGTVYLNHKIFDTSQYKGKMPQTAAYIVDQQGKFYALEYQFGKAHHSSLAAGKNVICSGMLKVINGKIMMINNHSGHYQPTKQKLQQITATLPDECFAETGKVVSIEKRFKWAERGLFSSSRLTRKVATSLYSYDIITEKLKKDCAPYALRELLQSDMYKPENTYKLRLLNYSLERETKSDYQKSFFSHSFSFFGHKCNISKTEKLAAANELKNVVFNHADPSILREHKDALNNGELGRIYRHLLR